MLKKLGISIIILSLFVLVFFIGYNIRGEAKGGIESKGLAYTIPDNNGASEFSYSIGLTNKNKKSVFIKTIKPSINDLMKNKILSKDITVTVNRTIHPNETIQVNGIIVVDTKGLFLFKDIGKLITDIKVSTEETVSVK